MRRFTLLTVVVGLVGLPGGLRAGSVDDFTDSYRGTQKSGRSGDESTEDEDDSSCEESCDSSEDWWSSDDRERSNQNDDSGAELVDPSGYLRMLLGVRPGAKFSLGRGPYEGRGRRMGDLDQLDGAGIADRINSPASVETFDASVSDDFHQLTFRSSALVTGRGDAAGVGLSARWNSTWLPGIAVSYEQVRELKPASTTLGFGYLLYEPDVGLGEHHRVSWNAGLAGIHSSDGVADLGGSVGLSGELYPLEPLFLNGRLQLHRFPGVWIGDAQGGVGVMLDSQLGLEANVRHRAIGGGERLTTWGLAVRSYVGF